MNEELQSANEELEASREELQSLDEELTAVNRPLLENVGELERANNDLNNLLTNTHIAALFLDPGLRIKRFTPDAVKLFRGAAPVVGRSLDEFRGTFPDVNLSNEAREVLETLVPAQRDVQSEDGGWYLRRVLPYRTHDSRIDGVMVTFTDVTELRQVYEAAREREQQFRAISDSAPVLIWLSGPDAWRTWFNKPWLEFTGRTLEQEAGSGWTQWIHPDDYERCLKVYRSSIDERRPFRMTFCLRRHDGEYRWVLDQGVRASLRRGSSPATSDRASTSPTASKWSSGSATAGSAIGRWSRPQRRSCGRRTREGGSSSGNCRSRSTRA